MKKTPKIVIYLGLSLLFPISASATPILFELSADGIDIADLGFSGSDTGKLSFSFEVDSSAFSGSNTEVNGVPADITFATPSTDLFSLSNFIGPVSKVTVVENTSTREIISYTGNPVQVNGNNYQLIARAYWPEGFLPLEPNYLPVDAIGYDLKIWDTSLDRNAAVYYTNLTGSARWANVPEPGTVALLVIGLAAMGYTRRRRDRQSEHSLAA